MYKVTWRAVNRIGHFEQIRTFHSYARAREWAVGYLEWSLVTITYVDNSDSVMDRFNRTTEAR